MKLTSARACVSKKQIFSDACPILSALRPPSPDSLLHGHKKNTMGRRPASAAASVASEDSYDKLFDTSSEEEEGEVQPPPAVIPPSLPARQEGASPACQVNRLSGSPENRARASSTATRRELAITFEDLEKLHPGQKRFTVLDNYFYWHELHDKASKLQIIVHVVCALHELRDKTDDASYALLFATMNRWKGELSRARREVG